MAKSIKHGIPRPYTGEWPVHVAEELPTHERHIKHRNMRPDFRMKIISVGAS